MKFWFAGLRNKNDMCLVNFRSYSRLRKNNSYLFHRNDFTTLITIPKNIRDKVKYNRKTREYESRLCWKELFDLNLIQEISHKF